MTKISAVIIAANEEKKIAKCLSSLQGVADEIIVLDSYSTDRTPAICKEFDVRFYQQTWKGYGAQKNDAIALAKYDYILSLDADEYLSEELQHSINRTKQQGLSGAYRMNRLNIYYGYALKHGMTYPDFKVRLFHRNEASWSLRAVHETPELIAGVKVQTIPGYLMHPSKDSMHDYITTINHYTTLGAKVYYESGKRTTILRVFFGPAFTFIQGYFFKLGFLDGGPGFIMALTQSVDNFLKYSKLYLLQRASKKI